MSPLPCLPHFEIVRALQRDGWAVVRQRGSHIRLHKHLHDKNLKLTVPAHNPVKRGTLRAILHQAELNEETFLKLLKGKHR